MKKVSALIAGLGVLALAQGVQAQSLLLDYSVEDLGNGTYNYEFSLRPDAGWQSGMGWRWFIWGDCNQCNSPLTAWAGDANDLPVGPWTFYTSSGGGHNGPTFGDVLQYWTPTSGSETLTWSGTSTADLQQGELLFSSLAGTLGGAVAPNFAVATRNDGGGLDCDAINSLKVKCKDGSFKVSGKIKSSLPEGTEITFVLDGSSGKTTTVNSRGKAKASFKRVSGGGHEVCVDTCDLCGQTSCS